MKKFEVVVNDLMQTNYVYYRTEPVGENFQLYFQPELIPKQVLKMGVFGGKYMTDCRYEFPTIGSRMPNYAPNTTIRS